MTQTFAGASAPRRAGPLRDRLRHQQSGADSFKERQLQTKGRTPNDPDSTHQAQGLENVTR